MKQLTASEIGTIGGKSKSKKKVDAARINAAKARIALKSKILSLSNTMPIIPRNPNE